jgi:hypothetical protein
MDHIDHFVGPRHVFGNVVRAMGEVVDFFVKNGGADGFGNPS